MDAKWKTGPDFAEVAEALGVDTVDIMALLPESFVLFTPYPGHIDPMIYSARLGRDADGILRAGPWKEVQTSSSFQAEADAGIRKALEEKLGPPPGRDDV